jgi:signal transduction histidine kinase
LFFLPLTLLLAGRLRQVRADRSRLAQQARSASSTERRKLAQALHDDVIQDLAGLGYALSATVSHLPADGDPKAGAMLRTADTMVHQSIGHLREILADIYPLHVEHADLASVLDDLAEPLRQRGVRTDVDVPTDIPLSPQTKAGLYRAVRELLRNVENHAQATRVEVRVEHVGDQVVVRVADDGVGFDSAAHLPARGHVGLGIMRDVVRERGGDLVISSSPGEGCCATVSLPALWSSEDTSSAWRR